MSGRDSPVRGTCLYPKGTYRAKSFFWRGGDEFTEMEYLQKEYVSAQSSLGKAKRELNEAQKEFNYVQKEFMDREGQVVALADSLGKNSTSTVEHASLRKQIAELTLDIENLNTKLAEAKSHAELTTITQLERERSEYFLCLGNLEEEIQKGENTMRENEFEFFGVLTTQEWRDAVETASEHEIAMRTKDLLRGSVQTAFEEQNYGDSHNQPPLKKSGTVDLSNPSIQLLRELLSERADLDRQCQHAEHRRKVWQMRRRVGVAHLLDELDRLDAALQTLGEEGLDMEALRRSHLPDGPLRPLKRPSSATSASRSENVSRSGRSKSDLKRPVRGGKGRLSPLGGRLADQ